MKLSRWLYRAARTAYAVFAVLLVGCGTAASPNFVLVGAQFNGPCDNSACPASATFTNQGGDGSAVAMFTLKAAVETGNAAVGTTLATCTVAIPAAPHGGSSTASCAITSLYLSQFFVLAGAGNGGVISLSVTVQNP